MRIFDLHNDALTCGGEAKRNGVIYAIWTTELTIDSALRIIEANKDKMLAIEDAGIFSDYLPCHDFKYCGLTWNDDNGLAGGAYSCGNLSDKGKRLIARLNDREIAVDTAHLNRKSFFEVAERANKIICSHTCFDAVNSHPRNLTYEEISVIIDKGGIVGLCFVSDFLGGNSIESLIRHIDWFLGTFGDGNLAIGTDFFGTTDTPIGLNSYADIDKLIMAMIRMGYSDATISRIMHDNAAAYFP